MAQPTSQHPPRLDKTAAIAAGGIRSCSHWLAINAGLDLRTSSELLRVGHALAELPLIRQAFSSGQLSLDKVRALILVATPADEELWLELALGADASPAGPHLPPVPALDGRRPARSRDSGGGLARGAVRLQLRGRHLPERQRRPPREGRPCSAPVGW